MESNFKKIILPILAVVIFSACEKNWDMANLNYTPKLVVHGYMLQNGYTYADIRKLLPPDDIYANDTCYRVKAEVISNGLVVKELLALNAFEFAAYFNCDITQKYFLRVSASGLPTVESELQSFPGKLEVRDFYIRVDSIDGTNSMFYYKYPENLPNGYIYVRTDTYMDGKPLQPMIEFISPFGVVDLSEIPNNQIYQYKNIRCIEYSEKRKKYDYADSVVVNFYSLSADMYTFYRKLREFDDLNGDVFYNGLQPLHFNIQHGVGYWGAITSTRLVFYYAGNKSYTLGRMD